MKPFSEVVIHFGNPQGMGQPPITFFRQVKQWLITRGDGREKGNMIIVKCRPWPLGLDIIDL